MDLSIQEKYLGNVLNIALETRLFLETIWPVWHQKDGLFFDIPSTCTCSRSSLFLKTLLKHYRIESSLETGIPFDADGNKINCGYYDRMGGEWQAHSWLRTDDLIIDITCDQFGGEKIFLGKSKFYKKSNFKPCFETIKKREKDVLYAWNKFVEKMIYDDIYKIKENTQILQEEKCTKY